MREGRDFDSKDLERHFNQTDRIDRIMNDIIDWENE